MIDEREEENGEKHTRVETEEEFHAALNRGEDVELTHERWTPSVGPLGGISKVDSAVLVAASKGNSERGRA